MCLQFILLSFFSFITTDDKASDRVLRRRSKRQKTVSVPTHSVSTSCSSTFSSSGGERDESLNISSEINEEHTEKGGKKVSYITYFFHLYIYHRKKYLSVIIEHACMDNK